MALVADYGSEDSNSSNSEPELSTKTVEQKKEVQTTTNFFDSSAIETDSENESDSEKQGSAARYQNPNTLPNPMRDKLPVPDLQGVKASKSIFSNPFSLAEQEKNQVLEQHVKMTECKTLPGSKKKVCIKFRQTGKCRFGKTCKYSHDCSSIRLETDSQNAEQNDDFAQQSTTKPFNKVYQVQNLPSSAAFGFKQSDDHEEDSDSYMAGLKKKKRPGMATHLVPPKRAMHSLMKQRQSERPWTVDK